MSKSILKAVHLKDHVSITYGVWFDKLYGNSYFDAVVEINDLTFEVSFQYGHHYGDNQAIDEILAAIGYRVKTFKDDRFKGYRAIHTDQMPKKKQELFKTTRQV